MICCGIDPGKNGAIVSIDEKFNIVYKATVPLISSSRVIDVPEFVRRIKISYADFVVMEKVGSIYGSSSKSNFTFGRVVGILEGVLYATNTKFIQSSPRTWQKTAWHGITPIKEPGGKKTNTKATSLLAARRLFPEENFLASSRSKKPHDGLVDAALIAYTAMLNYK